RGAGAGGKELPAGGQVGAVRRCAAGRSADVQSPPMGDHPLWTPSKEAIASSNLTAFMRQVEPRAGRRFRDYHDLHAWSVAEPAAFWAEVWRFLGIVASRPFERAVDDPKKMPGAKWFQGARLNFAENLLRFHDDRVAIVFRDETMRESRRLTYAELHDEVA